MAGARVVMSKFEGESGSSRSMFMVRQFAVAMIPVIAYGSCGGSSWWMWAIALDSGG